MIDKKANKISPVRAEKIFMGFEMKKVNFLFRTFEPPHLESLLTKEKGIHNFLKILIYKQ